MDFIAPGRPSVSRDPEVAHHTVFLMSDEMALQPSIAGNIGYNRDIDLVPAREGEAMPLDMDGMGERP
jgi:hypothetical protein